MRGSRGVSVVALLAAALLSPGRSQAQQNLGHKVLGTLGLEAGSQPEPGIYVADQVAFYSANRLVDRNGHSIPVGLDLDAFANGLGVAGVFHLPWLSTYLNVAIAIPIAHVSLNTDRPEASIDRFGLADLYVQPLKLGWRLRQLDLVAGYAFYAPTGRTEPGGNDGVGRGYWANEFSAGGTVFLDRARAWHLSALASYDLNGRKRGIDITRGDTIQIQGGAGVTLVRLVDVGLAGFAQWQVRDDRGADLPPAIRGARDQSFGLGPEVDIRLPPIRSQLTLRFVRDLSVKSRPQGQIFVVAVAVNAWPIAP